MCWQTLTCEESKPHFFPAWKETGFCNPKERQNNIIRSCAAASDSTSTDDIVFPFPFKE
jgi:hypothetical protein